MNRTNCIWHYRVESNCSILLMLYDPKDIMSYTQQENYLDCKSRVIFYNLYNVCKLCEQWCSRNKNSVSTRVYVNTAESLDWCSFFSLSITQTSVMERFCNIRFSNQMASVLLRQYIYYNGNNTEKISMLAPALG